MSPARIMTTCPIESRLMSDRRGEADGVGVSSRMVAGPVKATPPPSRPDTTARGRLGSRASPAKHCMSVRLGGIEGLHRYQHQCVHRTGGSCETIHKGAKCRSALSGWQRGVRRSTPRGGEDVFDASVAVVLTRAGKPRGFSTSNGVGPRFGDAVQLRDGNHNTDEPAINPSAALNQAQAHRRWEPTRPADRMS